ncbi:Protein kinase domain containing protein [Apostichopus japonicus]|uniref:Protein kinase domain containing protein n=1 Tax=Stichopus japonicus TaxID=307972 RepID=A0A2G8KWE4_STIJA|nr:Protein kinase domain containing protein [Apostichopus japonicus]
MGTPGCLLSFTTLSTSNTFSRRGQHFQDMDSPSRCQEKKILPSAAIDRIALSIVKALINVHSRGILHCDLKTDNIMLMPGFQDQTGPQIKLIDFGKAINMADRPKYEHFRAKRHTEALRRSYHIHPAVILGAMSYTEYSEIYSLCMIFIEMAGDHFQYLKNTGEMCVNKNFVQRSPMNKVLWLLTTDILIL